MFLRSAKRKGLTAARRKVPVVVDMPGSPAMSSADSSDMTKIWFSFQRKEDGSYDLLAFKTGPHDPWRELDMAQRSVSNHKILWQFVRAEVEGHAHRFVSMDWSTHAVQPFVDGKYSRVHDSLVEHQRHQEANDDLFQTEDESDDDQADETVIQRQLSKAKTRQGKKAAATKRKPKGAASDVDLSDMFNYMVRMQKDNMKVMHDQQATLLTQIREQQDLNRAIIHSMEGMVGAQERARSKKMTVTSFDGSSESAASWLMMYERACTANMWLDDGSRINNMKAALKPGSAADKWYSSRMLTNPNCTWQDWRQAFIEAFRMNFADATAKAMKWEYRGGSIMEYFYELERMLTLAYGPVVVAADSHRLLINNVTVGLPREFQMQICLCDPQSKAEFIQCLQRITVKAGRTGFRQGYGNQQREPEKATQERLDSNTKTGPAQGGSHQRPFFRNKSKTYGQAKQVTQVTNKSQSTEKGNGDDRSSSDEDKHVTQVSCDAIKRLPVYMVRVDPGNVTLKTLLDTGSEDDLISAKTVAMHKLPATAAKRNFIDFNGMAFTSSKYVTLTLKIADRAHAIKAWVFASLSYDLLLGMHTLQQLDIRLSNIERLRAPTCSNISTGRERMISSKEQIPMLFPMLLKPMKERQTAFTVSFRIRNDAPIIQMRPYRCTPAKEDFARQRVEEMLAEGLVEHTDSEFASPCVIVDRKDNPDGTPGKKRLCTDFRELNKWTIKDAFPVPHLDDLIRRAGGAKFFSKIDLKDSFYQVPLTLESRKYTAFVVPGYHVCYTCLPYGWINSSQKFQRFMTAHVLRELLHDRRIGNFIDDTWIAAETEEECQRLTYVVLERFAECGLIINLAKSEVCVPSIRLLGRVFDGITRTTRSECREKALNSKDPHDIRTLRSFCGLMDQFKDRIPHYSDLMRPFNHLKKKGVPFHWSDECKEAKMKLMRIITSDPILCLPNWQLPFELTADASHVGGGACLYQRDSSCSKFNQLRLIGFFSFAFNRHELQYDVGQKEALAVVRSIKHWRPYLEGRKFIVRTDHQSLLALKNKQEPKGRLSRWIHFLNQFQMEICHRKGSEMHDADFVSRLCVHPEAPEQVSAVMHDMDQNMTAKILSMFHDHPLSGGHSGVRNTIAKIKARFHWPNMTKEITQYVRSCHTCQYVKYRFRKKTDYLSTPTLATKPYETIHADHGELMKKAEGVATTRSFLVIVCEHTRMVHAKAMPETAQSLINYLQQQWYFSLIKNVICDNGPAFASERFSKFLKENGIKRRPTAPFNPQANGMAERRVGQIKTYAALYPHFQGGWKACIAAAADLINRTPNRVLGCSPLHMLTGKPTVLPADKEFQITADQLKTEKPLSQEEQQAQRQAEFEKRNMNKKFRKFHVGDWVLYHAEMKGRKPVIRGPAQVEEVIERDGHAKTLIIIDKGVEKAVAVKNAVHYHEREPVPVNETAAD